MGELLPCSNRPCPNFRRKVVEFADQRRGLAVVRDAECNISCANAGHIRQGFLAAPERVMRPLETSSDATPFAPARSSKKISFSPSDLQDSQFAVAFMAGVRLRASPPVAGTRKMSPPVLPSS